ncbi:25S rRNA (adenine-N(1))-methyltransferase [Staphylotrichum longicolle]|uniref:Ribosomal RNA-processing protein 8 n=1 Tax=Staphylotrichum longicolle TaxID=669026 RepID=A0AAD4I0I7_9PEZI|nr:25S rRNA (adenine-N(1))-methyltransferase [Staphylotrichum longicolle]
MFPVKGLSISAEKLRVETGGSTPAAAAASAPKPAKKRKRPGNSGDVTAANLADMWDKVIENKAPANKAQSKKDNKRQKKDHEPPAPGAAADVESTSQLASQEPQSQPMGKSEKKQKKKGKKEKRDSLATAAEPAEEEEEWNGIDDEERNAPEAAQPVKDKAGKKQKTPKSGASSKEDTSTDNKPRAEAAPRPAPPPPPAVKLTPLQASMREKLVSARFRHLNETLYTRPSDEAFQLFQDSPEMFNEYHEGFRRQVEVWPENPVDCYIADIKARAKVRFPPRNRDSNTPLLPSQLPLPNPPGTKSCTIADLGCGDAKLATALQPFKSKLRLDIRSFDLQTGGSPLVTRADIANLPLPDNSVDVAIFCLALMGTNWLDFVEEAYRILRWRGELWVAEIKSRFTNPETKKKVVAHSVGNRRKGAAAPASSSSSSTGNNNKDKKSAKAAQAAEEEEANLAELAVHVDGAEARRPQQHETDIGAFLEALRKRGFLLNRDLGEGAVDMGNKMFVRMHFVKAAPAIKGKCASAGAVDRSAGEKRWTDGKGRTVQKKKFIGGDDEDAGGADEAAVLKPCVYKIR